VFPSGLVQIRLPEKLKKSGKTEVQARGVDRGCIGTSAAKRVRLFAQDDIGIPEIDLRRSAERIRRGRPRTKDPLQVRQNRSR